jgi:putative transposase
MDGKGRATDNTWIERFWKSLKYDNVYLNPADTGLELHQGILNYIARILSSEQNPVFLRWPR